MKKSISSKQQDDLLQILKARFEKNMQRHKGFDWPSVLTLLQGNIEKVWTLNEMEKTGGEPDVVVLDKKIWVMFIFVIVQPKAHRVEEVYAMTDLRGSQGKKTNPNPVPSKWLRKWEFRF